MRSTQVVIKSRIGILGNGGRRREKERSSGDKVLEREIRKQDWKQDAKRRQQRFSRLLLSCRSSRSGSSLSLVPLRRRRGANPVPPSQPLLQSFQYPKIRSPGSGTRKSERARLTQPPQQPKASSRSERSSGARGSLGQSVIHFTVSFTHPPFSLPLDSKDPDDDPLA